MVLSLDSQSIQLYGAVESEGFGYIRVRVSLIPLAGRTTRQLRIRSEALTMIVRVVERSAWRCPYEEFVRGILRTIVRVTEQHLLPC
jgi:hypothetical protein